MTTRQKGDRRPVVRVFSPKVEKRNALDKAISQGRFLETIRSLADAESILDKAEGDGSLEGAIRYLRDYEAASVVARYRLQELPRCMERTSLMLRLEAIDNRAKKAWDLSFRKARKLERSRAA